MVYLVRRLIRPIAFLVVAAQLLLVVPAMASVISQSAAACGDMARAMSATGDHPHGDQCPCCPDGMQSLHDCLSSCTLIAALPAHVSAQPAPVSRQTATAPAVIAVAVVSEPPLKPPPISA
jgi:hypothetical protein